MLPPEIGAPLLALLYVTLLAATGLGPSMVLLRGRVDAALAFAPVVGLAVTSGILSTVAYVVPLRVAGPVVLVVLVLASAVMAWRCRARVPARQAFPVVALGVLGVAAACIPMWQRSGSYGPIDLHFADSWFYIPIDHFLAGHRLGEAPVDVAAHPWLATLTGVSANHTRVGVDVVETSMFALTATTPVRGVMAAQAALAALVPMATYGLARLIIGQRPRRWGIAAGVLALSPIVVQLFIDARPANLAALSLAVAFVGGAGLAVSRNGSSRDAVLVGVLACGMAVCYTEHLAVLVAATAATAVAALVAGPKRAALLRVIAQRSAVAFAVAIALSPLGIWRAASYALKLGDGSVVGGPALEGVHLRTAGPWVAGLLHQYDLAAPDSWGPLRTTLVYDVTIAVFALALLGVLRLRRSALPAALALAGGLVATSLAEFAYFQLKGDCSYCVQKSITLAPPFLSVTVVFGGLVLWAALHGSRWRLGLAATAAAWFVLMVTATVGLISATANSPMRLDDRDADIADAVQGLPRDASVLIEGSESGPDLTPFFDVAAALYLVSSTGHPVSYPEGATGFVGGPGLSPKPFRADYGYVLSRFPGMATSRRIIRRFGQYALYARPRVDAAIVNATAVRDPRDTGPMAVPWLRSFLPLRVSGTTGGVVVRAEVSGSAVSAATFSSSTGRLVASPRGTAPRTLCLWLPPGASTRDVSLIVNGLNVPETPRRIVDAPARSPRAAGVTSLRARSASRNPCSRG
jgi:hypothetical protein